MSFRPLQPCYQNQSQRCIEIHSRYIYGQPESKTHLNISVFPAGHADKADLGGRITLKGVSMS